MKLVFSLLFLLGSSLVGAETTAELFNQLKSAAKAEVRTSRDTKNPADQPRTQQLQELVVQLDRAEPGDYASANVLRAIESLEVLAASEKVADLCQALASHLRDEQKKQEAALVEEMQGGFTAALQAALRAKTVKELDAPMADVTRLVQKSNPDYSSNAKLRLLATQGQQLWEFLRQWQDYLADLQAGAVDGSRGRLQNLLNSGGDFSAFVPRSELLARLAELQKDRKPKEIRNETEAPSLQESDDKAAKIVGDAHGLKGMEDAIRKLEVLSADGLKRPFADPVSVALRNLQTLQRIYLDLEQGRATNIHLFDITENKTSEVEEALSRLRLQLLLYAVPRSLGLGETEAAQPGENSVNYLNRLAARAREKADWALLGRTIDIAQTLKIETTTAGNDRTALQSFLAGMNQERAGQYPLAVSSFQAALKAGSQIVPPEVMGEHLEKIRKDHPQDYEQGVQISLNPPAQPDRRFMDPRTRMSYVPGNPYAQGNAPPSPPSINVPAPTPNASGAPNTPRPVASDAPEAK